MVQESMKILLLLWK